tara:strand:+ start:606 stop:995 length:390 start_codon:yes stop_codon:yes gene_type:complete
LPGGGLYDSWFGIAVSPDFKHMIGASNNNLKVSHDGGLSFTLLNNAYNAYGNWRGISCNPNFTKVAAVVQNDEIYHSIYDGPIDTSTVWASFGPHTQLVSSDATGSAGKSKSTSTSISTSISICILQKG